MKAKKNPLFKAVAVMALILVYYACNPEESGLNGEARLRLHLTDAPGNYEAVYVDIQHIRIHRSDDENSDWVDLDNINAGVYDLLQLTNGIDTLLADHVLPPGKISQIRLILGERNAVKVDGDSIALKTPSAQQSGLKLKVNETLQAGITYNVWIDFDASRSVVKAGNSGKYILKPVVRTFTKATSGSIKGYVVPDSYQYDLYAIMGEDSVGGTTDQEGQFLIQGLETGIYKLSVVPPDGASVQGSVLTDISVTIGQITDVGEVLLEE